MPGKQGIVLCFDFQADCLERYLGKAVQLHLLSECGIFILKRDNPPQGFFIF